ncbi:MAG: hypothetical protein ACI841_001700 [Planctomycetota bacterium]|jgi:hypothetical protein
MLSNEPEILLSESGDLMKFIVLMSFIMGPSIAKWLRERMEGANDKREGMFTPQSRTAGTEQGRVPASRNAWDEEPDEVAIEILEETPLKEESPWGDIIRERLAEQRATLAPKRAEPESRLPESRLPESRLPESGHLTDLDSLPGKRLGSLTPPVAVDPQWSAPSNALPELASVLDGKDSFPLDENRVEAGSFGPVHELVSFSSSFTSGATSAPALGPSESHRRSVGRFAARPRGAQLRRAIVMSEVLAPPLALRGKDAQHGR